MTTGVVSLYMHNQMKRMAEDFKQENAKLKEQLKEHDKLLKEVDYLRETVAKLRRDINKKEVKNVPNTASSSAE